MNNIIYLVSFIFLSQLCLKKDIYYPLSENIVSAVDSFPKNLKGGTFTLGEFRKNYIEKPNIDSLNAWQSGEGLPRFLFQQDFDKIYIDCGAKRGRLSIRKRIFQQVTNRKVLKKILRTDAIALIMNSPKSINRCLHNTTDKYLFWSIKQLARERLKELEQKE